MIAPLASHGLLGDTGSLAVAFVIGIAFGWALERAGLGSARKLMGQFYLTDFTVFKVMFSAIVTAMLGTFWLARLGVLDLSAVYVPETFIQPQLAGGILFGVGFALAGLCPGTSCVAAATGRGDGLAVVGGMLSGVLLTGLAFDRLQSFYESGARGSLTLPQVLHVSQGVVIAIVVAAALCGFWIATRIERRSRVASASAARPIAFRRALPGTIAIVLAVGAALARTSSSTSAAPVPTTTTSAIERVSPLQLAAWIKDRQPGLHIIDVRSPAAFDEYHVPAAERHPIESLSTLPTASDRVTVVYGDDEQQSLAAAQGLPAGGRTYILSGGVGSWIDEVMSPTLAVGATPAERAAFSRTSELSRYLGGTPRVDVVTRVDRSPTAKPSTTSQAVQQVRRRGC